MFTYNRCYKNTWVRFEFMGGGTQNHTSCMANSLNIIERSTEILCKSHDQTSAQTMNRRLTICYQLELVKFV